MMKLKGKYFLNYPVVHILCKKKKISDTGNQIFNKSSITLCFYMCVIIHTQTQSERESSERYSVKL